MKKIVAMMLAMMLVLVCMSAALAAEGDSTTGFIATTGTSTTVSVPATAVQKEYTVTNVSGGSTDIFPAETLSFTATQATTGDPAQVAITIDGITVNKKSGSYTMTIKYAAGAFTKPGLYHYSVAESGNAQGVGYDTTPLKISIYVAPDVDANGTPVDTQLKVQHIGITKVGTGDNATKDDKIENTYKLGSLEVTKVVKGNLADVSQPFTMTVKLSAEKTVYTDITVTAEDGATVEGGASYTIEAGDGWTGTDEKTVTLTIKNAKTVTFTNIPDGVTYTVTESANHGDATGDPTETDPAKGYKIEYDKNEGSITGGAKTTCTVTNTKALEPDTGIELDTVPYMMIMAIALVGVAMMFVRRREEM